MVIRWLRYILVSLPTIFLLASYGYAEEETLASSVKQYLPLGSGLAIGLAAGAGGIGMGIAIFAALQGIARNPGTSGRLTTWLIVGLALIESLVIYALIIAFILAGKI